MPKQKRKHTTRTPTEILQRVRALAMNLHWTWSADAQRLFAALDPALWAALNHNPLKTLEMLPAERRERLCENERFAELLERCERDLRDYLRARMWFARTARPRDRRLLVAYFCSEFAIHESLPQYAGGLGVLAGDHLKSASDLGIPLVGVGLLYRRGYFRQEFDGDGSQRALYPYLDFKKLPIEDTRAIVDVPIGARIVRARVWRMIVGRTPLILLDADIPRNRPKDRSLTHYLYGGDAEVRLRQQILLGVGGVRALEKLGFRPTVYHLNEGHAAFCALERMRHLRSTGRSIRRAVREIRASSVFTTHTPVPAGHDRYEPRVLVRNLGALADEIGLSREELLGLGREKPDDRKEQFCMTVLALRLSEHCNGVSALHGEVSREMWRNLYSAPSASDVPIGHVTNGVHTQTWLAPEIQPLYRRYLRPRWTPADPDHDPWRNAATILPEELWEVRCTLRRKLVHFVRERLMEQIQRGVGPVAELLAIQRTFDEGALTIGFARRFATYKRAPLIFHDATRLARILNAPGSPVQIVLAGKAHPRDAAGQAFARRVYRFARRNGLRGRVVLLEDYDMHVGRMLTSGCDVWLNNPRRPNEASGTSGMKPPLHGGINCSILDGWWPEAYNGRNGWAIGDLKTETRSRAAQDRLDAEAIYGLLENEIVPLFYRRDRRGIPRGWVRKMVASMKSVCGVFNAHRMLAEYLERYYLPAHHGSQPPQ
jgi:starch phosphorylase